MHWSMVMLFTKKVIRIKWPLCNSNLVWAKICHMSPLLSTNPLLFILDFVLLWKFLQFMSLANLMLTGDAYEISYLAISLWNLKKNPNRMFLKLKKNLDENLSSFLSSILLWYTSHWFVCFFTVIIGFDGNLTALLCLV